MSYLEPDGRQRLPRLRVDLDAIRARYWAIPNTRTREDFRHALLVSVLDVLPLVSEVEELWTRLVDTRHRYANLLAAARATIGADRDGEPDPLFYLRDELAALYGDWA